MKEFEIPLHSTARPDSDLAAPDGGSYEAPRGLVEETVARIWRELLWLDQVGRLDNFFELGGHSLLIVQMMERLRRAGLTADVSRVFVSPRLADLALALIPVAEDRFEVPPNLIPPECEEITPKMLPLVELEPEYIKRIAQSFPGGMCNIQDIYPLAPLQEGILFHYLLNLERADTYVRPLLLSLPSRDKVEDLIQALQWAIDRHDILRTAVLWEQLPRAVQVVCRRATLPVEQLTLDSNRDPVEQLTERMNVLRQDLRQAPLMRLQIAENPHRHEWFAILQLHHMNCDHQTLEAMFAEVVIHLKGRAQSLPEPVPYRNHVAQALEHARTHDAETFFRGKLGDVDEPTLPFGILDVHGDGSQVTAAREELDARLVYRVVTQARRLGVSSATLFHAAFALVVACTSARDDVVFGSVLLGRMHSSDDAQRTFGMFINTLPLRIRLQNINARQLVEQTHRELVDLFTYEQSSLVVAQRCARLSGSTPLFTALLNYRRSEMDRESELARAAEIHVLGRVDRTNYPIFLSVDDIANQFTLSAQTDVRIDARRINGYLRTALASLVNALENALETPVLSLSILPDDECRQILELFNATHVPYPHDELVHGLFEEQVSRTPDAIAVVAEGRSLTYAELNSKANQLARHLRDYGVGPDKLVGICVERSLDMVVGLLGILKAGGAYVPLDPGYPTERLQYMMENAAPAILLTQRHLDNKLPQTTANIFAFDRDWEQVAHQDKSNIVARSMNLNSRNLAYVIYTSGSTGLPKGAMNEHRAVVNRLRWMQDQYRLGSDDRVLQKTPFSFDVSVWEFFWTTMTGARLIMARPEGHKDPAYLYKLIDEAGVTTLHFVPSMLQSFLDQFQPGRCPSLRHIVCSGEELSPSLQRQCFECLPDVRLSNLYGPTEAAVDVTAWECKRNDRSPRVPIGCPISNIHMYVLNGYSQPVPIGVPGEIYIGGVGVGRGYLNRPDLTADRFITDPFSNDSAARLYKTGDMGKWLPDGAIEYLGRNDRQVKIRGFRIELGEIEVQLAAHSQIKEAVVLAHEGGNGDKRIVAYVVPRDTGDAVVTVDALRMHLRPVLPEFMVPSAFVLMDSLPLTPNGKLDRRALPAPQIDAYATEEYEAPQDGAEESLAEIWRDLLKVQRVGRHDNFFDLGGHSLRALKLLYQIHQKFGIALPITEIYRSPTLNELAARIGGNVAADELVDASREAQLSEDIHARPGRCGVPAKSVLLTGCTGFVGRFLLDQLLRDTDASLYCLVRAQSREHAALRLKTTLLKWDLWEDEFERRISAIPGDLRRPKLGLDDITYELLAEEVDSIYHCATSMNHLETYAMSKSTNVEAAKDLLRLATYKKPKLVNHISTLSIFSADDSNQSRVVKEDSPIERERHTSSQGYIASKWVSERIFMNARERGIPCNIFRLGLVWADSKHGRYDELQREYRILKSCLLTGYGIKDYRYEMPPTPVDYVARAIVFLANQHSDGQGTFHISSTAQRTEDIFELCSEIADVSLELKSWFEWISEIKLLHNAGLSLPAVPLIQSAFSMSEQTFNERQRSIHLAHTRCDCSRTHQELERADILAPALDDELLRVTLEGMFSRDRELRALFEGDARYRSRNRNLRRTSIFELRSAAVSGKGAAR